MRNKSEELQKLKCSISDYLTGKPKPLSSELKNFFSTLTEQIPYIDDLFKNKKEQKYDSLKNYYLGLITQHVYLCQCIGCQKYDEKYKLPDGKVTFSDLLKESIKFCKRKQNRNLALRLNELLLAWDDMLQERHKTVASHCVMLLETKPQKGVPQCGLSQMITPDIADDIRLILLYVVPQKRFKEKLMVCLHELGHYIGCRCRRNRVFLYSNLCAMSFCERVYRIAWSQVLSIKPENTLPNRATYDGYSTQIRRQMLASKHAMERSMNNVQGCFREAFPTLGDDLLYMHIMRKGMLNHINSHKERIQNIISDACNDDSQINTFVRDAFKKATDKVIAETEGTQESNEETWDFIERVELLFEEIAADVFMVRVAGIKSTEVYLKCILEEAYDLHNIEGSANEEETTHIKEPFWHFVLSDILRIRICTMMYVLRDARPWKWRTAVWLMQLFPHKKMLKRVFWQAGKLLEIQYTKLLDVDSLIATEHNWVDGKYHEFLEQDIWNPIRVYAAYAVTIYQDELYQDTCGREELTAARQLDWENAAHNKQEDIRKAVEMIRKIERCWLNRLF